MRSDAKIRKITRTEKETEYTKCGKGTRQSRKEKGECYTDGEEMERDGDS